MRKNKEMKFYEFVLILFCVFCAVIVIWAFNGFPGMEKKAVSNEETFMSWEILGLRIESENDYKMVNWDNGILTLNIKELCNMKGTTTEFYEIMPIKVNWTNINPCL